jgi:MOSC domain-containing protein YiiM
MDVVVATRFDGQIARLHEAPANAGRLELIVRRPATDERERIDEARLDPDLGLVGDRWASQHQATTPRFLQAQLTLISTRLLATIEPDRERWPLAGDQLYVDLDLCEEHLPTGSRLAIGPTVIEVSETPHTGCAKFSARFGGEALRWINSPIGRAHRLRGLNAWVVDGGTIHAGDTIRRV